MSVSAGHGWFLLVFVVLWAAVLAVAVWIGGYLLGWAFRRGWERGAPRPPGGPG